MRTLASEGMTMLVVTHEMAFARDLSDRVVVLVDGIIIEEGLPDLVFKNPENPRTREFLGRTLSGTFERNSGATDICLDVT